MTDQVREHLLGAPGPVECVTELHEPAQLPSALTQPSLVQGRAHRRDRADHEHRDHVETRSETAGVARRRELRRTEVSRKGESVDAAEQERVPDRELKTGAI